jgi:hypothetical protein
MSFGGASFDFATILNTKPQTHKCARHTGREETEMNENQTKEHGDCECNSRERRRLTISAQSKMRDSQTCRGRSASTATCIAHVHEQTQTQTNAIVSSLVTRKMIADTNNREIKFGVAQNDDKLKCETESENVPE